MSEQLIETIEARIVARLEDQLAYLRTPDGSRCRGVMDAQTAIAFEGIEAPAALVQYQGERVSGILGEGVVGLPVDRQFDFFWRVFLISSSFSHFGEGRTGAAKVAGAQGAYRLVDDVFNALQGFQVRSDHDSRLLSQGSSYRTILDGRIIYISDWRHWTRRVGSIAT